MRKYVADKQKKFQEAKEMRENLNWAVLGTGVIANEMAQALQKMGKSLYAVGNRTHQKAVDFAEKYGVGKVYDQIDWPLLRCPYKNRHEKAAYSIQRISGNSKERYIYFILF